MSFRSLITRSAALLAFAIATPVLTHAQDLGIAIGEKAPGGPLETLDGKPVDLTAYLGKQPVVLEFWATWCDNCKKLDPTMRAAHTTFGKSVQFITVAVSVNQTAERVKAYQQRYALPGVVLYDRKGVVSGAYDAPATSYVVVIDKRGTVIYTGLGGTQNLDAAIRKAL
ncbi:MAG: hypothetical protein RLZZ621_2002 [Gemmatimonadota bacterium]